MLAAAALVPSAPLLLAQVTPELPAQLEDLRASLRATLFALGDSEVAVLVAGAEATEVRTAARADLSGIGRPDVSADLPVPARAARAIADSCGLGRQRGALPLDLAVLALHAGRPVVPVTVDSRADAEALAYLGGALVAGLADAGVRAVMVAAGDGSAGLGRAAPRPHVPGAERWQSDYQAAIGDVAALGRLGPGEAERVSARGWAPAVAVSAACAAAGLRLEVSAAAAPRGVGYVVAGAAG